MINVLMAPTIRQLFIKDKFKFKINRFNKTLKINWVIDITKKLSL